MSVALMLYQQLDFRKWFPDVHIHLFAPVSACVPQQKLFDFTLTAVTLNRENIPLKTDIFPQ